jgi:phage tail sheath protein FI
MPVALSYPGVYIQETPSTVHTIGPVSTSVAAFVDYFKWGPTNIPVQILGMADFDRLFGGIDTRSEASYAIQQFFLNGGTEAWVVRVVNGATQADITILDGTVAAKAALVVTALNPGEWANRLRVRIDNATSSDADFDLTVSLYGTDSRGQDMMAKRETFRALSMDSTRSNFVERIVNDPADGSALVRVALAPSAGSANRPLANGAVSAVLTTAPTGSQTGKVTINGLPAAGSPFSLTLSASATLTEVALALENAIRQIAGGDIRLAAATVTIAGGRLQVRLGPSAPSDVLTVSADGLGFKGAATFNNQEYALGGAATTGTAQAAGNRGADGSLPNAAALMGNPVDKSGIYALDGVDLFNLLCIPRTAIAHTSAGNGLTYTESDQVMTLAISYAASRRAMFLMDPPIDLDTPIEIKSWVAAHADTLRDPNAALFYPRLLIADPLDDMRLRSFGPSGTMAGLFASIDTSRGVWKAPAGSETSLRNVAALDYTLTDAENGTLNPLAINCLRVFPVSGIVSWGARTLDGADRQSSQWKYIPVRRVALYIEESLFRGTKWVVFEPNDESQWGQIRMNLDAFMHNLFRLGAFQGQTPKEAYFVKCDRETNPQSQIDAGIVNVVVGFAPLKPAEFVVIQIQQIAGSTGVQ